MRKHSRMFIPVLLCAFLTLLAYPQDKRWAKDERDHTAWIAGALNAMQTIKVGMIRSDLVKLFTTEGGLSTTSQRTYVYRQCPYIKVDVKFAASSRDGELPTDKIVEVSRPYLAWSVGD